MLHHQCEVRVNRWSIHFCHRNHECEASVGGSGASGFGALSASSGNGGGVLQGGIVEIGIDRGGGALPVSEQPPTHRPARQAFVAPASGGRGRSSARRPSCSGRRNRPRATGRAGGGSWIAFGPVLLSRSTAQVPYMQSRLIPVATRCTWH